MIDDTTTSATMPHTRYPSASPFSTRVITWPTSSGWASVVIAEKTLKSATTIRVPRCSKRKGRSWRKVARGPSSRARRPRVRRGEAVVVTVYLVRPERGLSTTVLLVHGLSAHAEGRGDRLPGVSLIACPAHLHLLGQSDLAPNLREPVQLGDRSAFGRRADQGADVVAAHRYPSGRSDAGGSGIRMSTIVDELEYVNRC